VHLLTDLDNFTRKLVTNAERLYTIAVARLTEVVAVIHMQIRATDTAALDIYDDAVFGL
jgi:hypothetical protein